MAWEIPYTPPSNPEPSDLITIEETRRFVKIGNPNDENQIVHTLRASQAYLERFTNRMFRKRIDYTQRFSPRERGSRLRLLLLPVHSIASVIEWEPGRTAEENASPLSTALYEVDYASGRVVRLSSGCCTGRCSPPLWASRVKVTYTGGFTADDCPYDIVEALRIQIIYSMERWQSANVSVASKGIERSSSTFISNDLHPQFKQLLNFYKVRTC